MTKLRFAVVMLAGLVLADELEAQRDMARRIENARLEVIADAGPAVFLDQPERLNDLLADFLRLGAP